MTASFKKAFPWVPVKDSAEEVRASVVTAGTGPGKGESQLSGASDVTPSTSLARPPRTSSSVPCIHKGPEQSSFKDFLVTLLRQRLRDLLFSSCPGSSSSSPNAVLLCGNGEGSRTPVLGSRSLLFSRPNPLVPLNMPQRPDDPRLNPCLSSPVFEAA